MSTFTTKFNTGDTAYLVDPVTAVLTKLLISEIFISKSLATNNTARIVYRVRRVDSSYPALNREYSETELYTTDEAKSAASQILLQKQADLQNLG